MGSNLLTWVIVEMKKYVDAIQFILVILEHHVFSAPLVYVSSVLCSPPLVPVWGRKKILVLNSFYVNCILVNV